MGQETVKPKREFPSFPFNPYPIQIDFMNFLYNSLNNGGISMLESPTGTGKTLSIICSALQWIIDKRNEVKYEKVNFSNGDEEEPDWMKNYSTEKVEEKKETRKKKVGFGFGFGNLDEKVKEKETEKDDEAEFLLDEYESEEEIGLKRKGKKFDNLSSSDEGGDEEEEEVVDKKPKLFFTSRTHSQLSQFVKEFRRTKFSSELNLVCLGSRKNMCINHEVSKLGNSNLINERCLELQKNSKSSKTKTNGEKLNRKKATCSCPMLKKQSLRMQFKNEAWDHEALDIEDLVQLGTKIGSCPYYGSRDMVKEADIVVLPYQSLLLSSARVSLGLDLKNSVIVVDEAHNLADSLTNMYNCKISVSQLKQVLSHLELYLERFRSRLGAGNRRYIQTLIALTKSFIHLLLDCQDGPCDTSMTINEFVFSLDIDNINLVKLHHYVKESKIVHKIHGYATKLVNPQKDNSPEGSVVSGFQALLDILISLINYDSEGRIIISKQKLSCPGQTKEGYIKFVMLSGEKIFSKILEEAYAVVLAGGTLQPIEETRVRLFPKLSISEIQFFTCKHIVPPESILPVAVSCGPSGKNFDFSYNTRSSSCMIEELGRLLGNLASVIPEGIVIFFSSFDYEEQVYNSWNSSGILSKILKKKRIFREPRNNNDIENVLKNYKETIISCTSSVKESINGALLLAVVGGKISEGINFCDGMGRCVIMVGLPYPSPSDLELMERVKHIEGLGESNTCKVSKPFSLKSNENNAVQSGFEILRSCKQRGREYYENLCMKAVNQSIGRAIRHVNDYAAILLVDSRYACSLSNKGLSHPAEKLPLWIKERLVSTAKNYGEVHKLLHQFFLFNKQKGIR